MIKRSANPDKDWSFIRKVTKIIFKTPNLSLHLHLLYNLWMQPMDFEQEQEEENKHLEFIVLVKADLHSLDIQKSTTKY